MGLETIMLNEIREWKMNTVWYYLYVESEKKTKQWILKKKKKEETHRYREQTSGYQW